MPTIYKNFIMEGMRGTLGSKLVFRVSKGRTIVSMKPKYSDGRVFSEAQLAQQEAFSDAILYGQAKKDEEIYKTLATGSKKSAFNIAVADWFHAPEVKDIDLSGWHGAAGEPIRVQALDDVHVKHVIIRIKDGNGDLLEEGSAAETTEMHWYEYAAVGSYTGTLTVTATAIDLPGNMTDLSLEKTIS